MNTFQKVCLAIVIALLLGLAYSCYMLMTVTFGASAQNMDNMWTNNQHSVLYTSYGLNRIMQDTFSFDRAILHAPFDHNYIVANTLVHGSANQSRCWLQSYTSRYNDSTKWMVDNCWVLPSTGKVVTSNDHERGERVQNSPAVTIDQPVQDTPQVNNDDNPTKIVEPPAPKNDNPCKETKVKEDKKGNPGNLKNVGNAGEKDDKGMDENLSPRGDGSGNGQHGNSDNPDKGNGKNKNH